MMKSSAVKTTTLGPIANVSRITLGGGGLGAVWGETSADEAVATVHAAVEAGVTLIDTAPMYRDCEAVIARAFEGRIPAGVRITTKCFLGAPPAAEVAARLEASLDASLAAMSWTASTSFSCTATSAPTTTFTPAARAGAIASPRHGRSMSAKWSRRWRR